MRISDIFSLAFMGLQRRKTRTFLTVSGVVVGTLCIVLMLSIGISNVNQFQEGWYANASLKQISVSPGVGSQGAAAGNAARGTRGLSARDIEILRSLSDVADVSPIVSLPMTVTVNQYQATLYVQAMDLRLLEPEFMYGGLPEYTGEAGLHPEMVIGYYQLLSFVDPKDTDGSQWKSDGPTLPKIDWANDKIWMRLGYGYEEESGESGASLVSRQYVLRVSGVTAESYDSVGYNSYMSIEDAERLLSENRRLADSLGIAVGLYDSAIVVADDIGRVASLMEAITDLGFAAYSDSEWIQQMQEEQGRQQSQLFMIGFITLFVSAIGIANTMYASILERRREIAVMKVVGMPIRKIRWLFLTEAAIIGGFGGVLGLLISYAVSFFFSLQEGATSFLGMYFSNGIRLQIPAWLALGAVGIALCVGVISGIYPAMKATRMRAMEAMNV